MTAPVTCEDVQRLVAKLSEGRILTSIVVMAEVIDEDGDPAIIILRDETDAPWRQLGLVQTALRYCEQRVSDALFGEAP